MYKTARSPYNPSPAIAIPCFARRRSWETHHLFPQTRRRPHPASSIRSGNVSGSSTIACAPSGLTSGGSSLHHVSRQTSSPGHGRARGRGVSQPSCGRSRDQRLDPEPGAGGSAVSLPRGPRSRAALARRRHSRETAGASARGHDACRNRSALCYDIRTIRLFFALL